MTQEPTAAFIPKIAATLWALNTNVMRDPSSTLDQSLKRRLGAVASKVNGCAYCTTSHCAILKTQPARARKAAAWRTRN